MILLADSEGQMHRLIWAFDFLHMPKDTFLQGPAHFISATTAKVFS